MLRRGCNSGLQPWFISPEGLSYESEYPYGPPITEGLPSKRLYLIFYKMGVSPSLRLLMAIYLKTNAFFIFRPWAEQITKKSFRFNILETSYWSQGDTPISYFSKRAGRKGGLPMAWYLITVPQKQQAPCLLISKEMLTVLLTSSMIKSKFLWSLRSEACQTCRQTHKGWQKGKLRLRLQ